MLQASGFGLYLILTLTLTYHGLRLARVSEEVKLEGYDLSVTEMMRCSTVGGVWVHMNVL